MIASGLNHVAHMTVESLQDPNFSSQEELERYINEKIGPLKRIENELCTDIRLANRSNLKGTGYSLNGRGELIQDSDSKTVGGLYT